jgi:hypothetical protein
MIGPTVAGLVIAKTGTGWAFLLDEYQSCSGEEMAIVYRHGETINDEARRDDDGAAIPCIVWKRAAVWRAVEPATVARRV